MAEGLNVGSLWSSLSLDLSPFKKGIEEANTLTKSLGKNLQTTVAGGDMALMGEGVKRISAEFKGLGRVLESSLGRRAREKMDKLSSGVIKLHDDMYALSHMIQRSMGTTTQITIGQFTSTLLTASTALDLLGSAQIASGIEKVTNSIVTLGVVTERYLEKPIDNIMSGMSARLQEAAEKIKTASSVIQQSLGRDLTLTLDQASAAVRTFNLGLKDIPLTQTNAAARGFRRMAAGIREANEAGATGSTIGAAQAMEAGTIQAEAAANVLQTANTQLNTAVESGTAAVSKAGKAAQKAIGPELVENIEGTRARLKSFFKDLTSGLKDFKRIVAGIVVSQAFYSFLREIREGVARVWRFNLQVERLVASFGSLMGDKREAEVFLEVLRGFSGQTPFNFTQYARLSQEFLAIGISAEAMIDVLRTLSDAVALRGGGPQQLSYLSGVMQKIATQTRFTREEFKQLEKLIPIRDILKEQLGLTDAQIDDIGNQGIRGAQAFRVIMRGLNKIAAGESARLADTAGGILTTVADNTLSIFGRLGKGLTDSITDSLLRPLRTLTAAMDASLSSGGVSQLFEDFVPDDIKVAIEQIVVAFKLLGKAVVDIVKIVGPHLVLAFKLFLNVLGPATLAIAGLVRSLTYALWWVLENVKGMRLLFHVLTTLLVAVVVAKAFNILAKAMAITNLVVILTKALQQLRNVMLVITTIISWKVALVIALAAAFLYLSGAMSYVVTALRWLWEGLSRILGISAEDIFSSDSLKLANEEIAKYQKSLEEAWDSMKLGIDVTDEATDAMKKFLAPFDEVFGISEDAGAQFKFDLDLPEMGNIDTGIDDILNDLKELEEERDKLNPLFPAKKDPGGGDGSAPATNWWAAIALGAVALTEAMKQALERMRQEMEKWREGVQQPAYVNLVLLTAAAAIALAAFLLLIPKTAVISLAVVGIALAMQGIDQVAQAISELNNQEIRLDINTGEIETAAQELERLQKQDIGQGAEIIRSTDIGQGAEIITGPGVGVEMIPWELIPPETMTIIDEQIAQMEAQKAEMEAQKEATKENTEEISEFQKNLLRIQAGWISGTTFGIGANKLLKGAEEEGPEFQEFFQKEIVDSMAFRISNILGSAGMGLLIGRGSGTTAAGSAATGPLNNVVQFSGKAAAVKDMGRTIAAGLATALGVLVPQLAGRGKAEATTADTGVDVITGAAPKIDIPKTELDEQLKEIETFKDDAVDIFEGPFFTGVKKGISSVWEMIKATNSINVPIATIGFSDYNTQAVNLLGNNLSQKAGDSVKDTWQTMEKTSEQYLPDALKPFELFRTKLQESTGINLSSDLDLNITKAWNTMTDRGWERVGNAASSPLNPFRNLVNSITGPSGSLNTKLVPEAGQAMKNAWDRMKTEGDNSKGEAEKPFTALVSNLREKLATGLTNVLVGPINTNIIDVLNETLKSVSSLDIQSVIGAGVSTAKKVGSAIISPLRRLTGLQTGGIVDREMIARLGEGNKSEAVLPLENPTAMKRVADAIAEHLGFADNTQTGTQRPMNHYSIGILVADDRGLTELERRLQAVRVQEEDRIGGALFA